MSCATFSVLGVLSGDLLGRPRRRRTARRARPDAPSGRRPRRRAAGRRAARACSSEPGSVKFTTTERPSAETVLTRSPGRAGSRCRRGPSIRRRRRTTSADRRGDLGLIGALALHEDLLAGLLGEARGVDDHVAALGLAVARGRIIDACSGRPCRRATVARTTNTIQPRMAGLRCWALQRPTCAARLRGFIWEVSFDRGSEDGPKPPSGRHAGFAGRQASGGGTGFPARGG